MIKGKNTKPEIIVRKALFKAGFRYRINVKKLPGTPDIVLPRYKTVIFVNGCFWHGHSDCPRFVIPKTRTAWWMNKIRQNQDRDRKKCALLSEMGWNIIIVWECELNKESFDKTIMSITDKIMSADKPTLIY